jgi:hypothetical protein
MRIALDKFCTAFGCAKDLGVQVVSVDSSPGAYICSDCLKEAEEALTASRKKRKEKS